MEIMDMLYDMGDLHEILQCHTRIHVSIMREAYLISFKSHQTSQIDFFSPYKENR